MAKKLKTYKVLARALNNFSSVSLDINVFNKKGENVFKKTKESVAIVFPVPYLSFIEENGKSFTLETNNRGCNWDGILEYSTDTNAWTRWDGTKINSSSDGKLYIRGKGNTKITGDVNNRWSFPSSCRIKCLGNIENLLDYESVEAGVNPYMAKYCYEGLFYYCTSITQAPELPAMILAEGCYKSMFVNCTSLIQAPALPAFTLAYDCYNNIFKNCTSLTGQIHCASSTSNADYRLSDYDISDTSAIIVYDL